MKNFAALRLMLFFAVLLLASCAERDGGEGEDRWAVGRARMLRTLRAHGIEEGRVLEALEKVRRHVYVPEDYRSRYDVYGDHPSPIGHGQTISQPYIVAYMTEKIDPRPGERILEIGTGSGYQAAVLAELGAEVYSIEIVPELAEHARKALASEGYGNVRVLTGDGWLGWPEESPFDAIIVTCAPEDIPQALTEQLKDGGRMILPVGAGVQRLVIVRKKGGKIEVEADLPVRFVPMVHGKDDIATKAPRH